MNKKALWFSIGLAIITVYVLSSAYVILHYKKDRLKSYELGKRQFEIIEGYQEAERALLYFDLVAQQASYRSVYELAYNGGLNAPKCDSYFGYNLWQTKNTEFLECFPIYSEEYEKSFTKEFYSLLLKYREENIDYKITTAQAESYGSPVFETFGFPTSVIEFDVEKR